ncbi:hypothetical protein HDU67_004565 [Dinochytrium kinnereticum]|nr:hypothetical protein HDU67_004565 [Dinochytrium kinnereticum]
MAGAVPSLVAVPLMGILTDRGVAVAAYTYVSDTTDSSTRSRDFAIMDSINMVSGLCAPFIGGLLSSYSGNFATPIFLAVAILSLSITYVIFLVPESLRTSPILPIDPPSSITAMVEASATAAAAVGEPLEVKSLSNAVKGLWLDLVSSLTVISQGPLLIMTIVIALHAFCIEGTNSYILFFTSLRLQWGEAEQGTFFLAAAFYKMFYLMLVLPALVAWFERSGKFGEKRTVKERTSFELRMIMVGLFLYGVGFSLIYGITSGWQFYVVISIESFASILIPLPKSVLSKAVPESKMGRLMGAISFVESISGLVDMITVNQYPGITFFICGIIATINIVLMGFVNRVELAEQIVLVERLNPVSSQGEEVVVTKRTGADDLEDA